MSFLSDQEVVEIKPSFVWSFLCVNVYVKSVYEYYKTANLLTIFTVPTEKVDTFYRA